MSDDQILANLKQGGRKREEAIEYLHDSHIQLVRFFHRKYAMVEKEKIKDVYVDSLLALIKNIKDGKYRQEGSLIGYLRRIMGFKCIDLSRAELSKTAQLKKEMELKNNDKEIMVASLDQNEEQKLIMKEQIRKFKALASAKGSNCWKIIELFFIEGYKMKEIAKELGLASEASVRVTKSKCLAKLRHSLMRQP